MRPRSPADGVPQRRTRSVRTEHDAAIEERQALIAVHAARRRLYRPAVVGAVTAVFALVWLGLVGLVLDRPSLGSVGDLLGHWWTALPRIGLGDALAVLAVLATIIITLSLTGGGATRHDVSRADLLDPGTLARDEFRELIISAATTIGVLAALMGTVRLLEEAEPSARFSTGPVGEAVAVLALAAMLAAVAAMADRHSSAEIRALESQVRADSLVLLESRLRRVAGPTFSRRVGRRPARLVWRPLTVAAACGGALGAGVSIVVASTSGRTFDGDAPIVDGLLVTVGVALLVLVTSWATLRVMGRAFARTEHHVGRRVAAADLPVILWALGWLGLLCVASLWLRVPASAPTQAAELVLAGVGLAALVLPVPVWGFVGLRHRPTRRRITVHGMLTDRVPALRETYSQALRMHEHEGPEA